MSTSYLTSAAELSGVIQAIDLASQETGGSGTTYTIELAPGMTLTEAADLKAVNLSAGDTIDIIGNGATLNGASAYEGLFAYAGTLNVEDLTITNAIAVGGAGGIGSFGGGGGAGLGGGLFVAAGANVTLDDVVFNDDAAKGGAGGTGTPEHGGVGAGGGLNGGAGGNGSSNGYDGGGGGVGLGANGGNAPDGSGAAGIIPGPEGGQASAGAGGASGGGGGAGEAGAPGGVVAPGEPNGTGGFGGGSAYFERGGFGCPAGGGGLGHGQEASSSYGGGSGGSTDGGGGLGAGGDIFVQQGGQLTIGNGMLTGGVAIGGAGGGTTGGEGEGLGSGLFIQGNQAVTLAPAARQDLFFGDAIADEAGSGGGAGSGAGTLVIDGPGIVILAMANSFTGGVTLDAGVLEIGPAGSAGSGTIDFAGKSSILMLDGAPASGSTYANTLANFPAGGTIDFHDIVYHRGATAIASGTTLTLYDDGIVENFQLSAPSTAKFEAFSDGSGIGITVACYLRGTRIATTAGEVAVESLAVVDLARTASGGLRPIRWIGHREIDCTAHPNPASAWPVRVRAGAFGAGLPVRDVWLSPDHAVFVDGVLIPVRLLLNGATIRQVPRDRVMYYHLALDRHDIVLAEGLPSESYLDTGNRGFFQNADAAVTLHPDLTPPADAGTRYRAAGACAELATSEALVRPIWTRLAMRAESLGYRVTLPEATALTVPHLVVDGRIVRAIHADRTGVVFALPRGAREVCAVSPTASPASRQPWLDDRRLLGVAVASIRLGGEAGWQGIALDDPALGKGWWEAERDGSRVWRWTDGAAMLRVPAAVTTLELGFVGPARSTKAAVAEARAFAKTTPPRPAAPVRRGSRAHPPPAPTRRSA